MQIQFAVQSYQARALPLAAQQVVNLYAEQAPQDAKDRVVLYGSPGIKSFADDVGTGPIRGMDFMAGVLYAISGCELYSVDSTGKATALGNICTGQVAGSAPASVSFSITAGTNSAGTNTISSITIDGVELLIAPVDWVTSDAATALAIKVLIDSGGGLKSASYDNISFDYSNETTAAAGLTFNDDGTKMYLHTVSDAFQYNLIAGWDLSTASYSGITGALKSTTRDMAFSVDGTKLYITRTSGSGSNSFISEFSLLIPFDISNANTTDLGSTQMMTQTFDEIDSLFLKTDGTKVYISNTNTVVGNTNTIQQFSLSIPFQIVGSRSDDGVSLDISAEFGTVRPTGMFISNDGLRLFLLKSSTEDIVYQYTFGAAWDLSTASYSGISFDVSSEDTAPLGLYFRDDGSKMYMSGGSLPDSVYQYSLALRTGYVVSVSGARITISGPNGPDDNDLPVIITTTGDVLVDETELTLSGGYLIEGGLSALPSDLGRVSMTHNAASTPQLVIVDGFNGWIFTTTGGLQRITDVDFLPADVVDFQDQMFIFNRAGTGQFFLSNLNDGTVYTATDIATAEGDPDDLVALISNHRELWLFGKNTIEVWYNSGDSDFTFNRFEGAFIERGCAAAFSIAEDDNTIFWLGEDRIVYRANGYTPQRVSQHAIEEAIRGYAVVADACAFIYTMAGHKFYILTFIDAKATWVFDITTGLWHERESFGLGLWRATTYASAYGRHLVGDYKEGKIGELDLDTFEEYGQVMQGLATGPPVYADRKRVFHRRFELDIEAGTGLTNGQGSDPQVWLDWTDDGGHTFSARKPFRSMGKIGAYRQRLRWLRLGQARQRIYRLTVSDPVKRSIVAAHLDAEGAAH